MLRTGLHSLLTLSFALAIACGFSQSQKADSLIAALKNCRHDSDKVNTLLTLANETYLGNPGKAFGYCEEALKISQQANYLKGLSAAYGWLGFLHSENGDRIAAIDYYNKSSAYKRKTGDKKGLAENLIGLGVIHKQQGEIKLALECYESALKILEELNDRKTAAIAMNNIGLVYSTQGDIGKAMEYFNLCLKSEQESGNTRGAIYTLNNIGLMFREKKQLDKALEYYTKSLEIANAGGDKKGTALCYNNIGLVYKTQGQLNEALDYYKRGLKLREELNDKNGMSFSLNNIGSLYITQKKFPQAIACCERSLKIAMELGYPANIRNSALHLKNVYRETGNYKKALEMEELYIKMRDSIANEETKKASIRNQLKHEYEKRAATISAKNAADQKIKDAQLVAQNAKLEHERMLFWLLIAGLVFVLMCLAFVISRFRITRQQKRIIEEQKEKVDSAYATLEIKNKEVLDSINYAKRIQHSLLTTEFYISKSLARLKNNSKTRS